MNLETIGDYTLSSAFLGWRSLRFLKSSSIFLLVALALDFASFLKRIFVSWRQSMDFTFFFSYLLYLICFQVSFPEKWAKETFFFITYSSNETI